jgi:hypothetical protein
LDSRDIVGSTLLALLGLLVLSMSFGYGIGTFSEMGPGFFPMILGGTAIILAAAIGIPALRRQEVLPRPSWRPLMGVGLGIAFFALTVESFGVLPAIMLVAIVVGTSNRESRALEVGVLAAILAFLIWAVFFKLLGMPLTAFRFS